MKYTKKIPTEVYSRIVGYFRPIHQWNNGKKEEYMERKEYNVHDLKNRLYSHHQHLI